MLDKQFIAEFLGTFIFLSVILTAKQALPIGIALIACIYFSANISGGHLNPAVSTMFWFSGELSTDRLMKNVVAQMLGAYVAYKYYLYNNAN